MDTHKLMTSYDKNNMISDEVLSHVEFCVGTNELSNNHNSMVS